MATDYRLPIIYTFLTTLTGSCHATYMLFESPHKLNWVEARDLCASQGMTLPQTSAFIREFLTFTFSNLEEELLWADVRCSWKNLNGQDLILPEIENFTNEWQWNNSRTLELECHGLFNSTNATNSCQLKIAKGSPSNQTACVKTDRCPNNYTDYGVFCVVPNTRDCGNVSTSSDTIMDLVRNGSYLPAGSYHIGLGNYSCHTEKGKLVNLPLNKFPGVNAMCASYAAQDGFFSIPGYTIDVTDCQTNLTKYIVCLSANSSKPSIRTDHLTTAYKKELVISELWISTNTPSASSALIDANSSKPSYTSDNSTTVNKTEMETSEATSLLNSNSSKLPNTTDHFTPAYKTDFVTSELLPTARTSSVSTVLLDEKTVLVALGALGVLVLITIIAIGILLCMRSRLNKMEEKLKLLMSEQANSASEKPETSTEETDYMNPAVFIHLDAVDAVYDLVPYESQY